MFAGRYRFRVAPMPTLAVLILLPTLVGLGFWQLDRAAQKRAIQAEYDARSRDAHVQLGSSVQAPEELRFYRVIVKGTYDTAYEVLIDNRIRKGQAGYHVITPLRVTGSDVRVLVNRGWVPIGRTRTELPRLDTPEAIVEITGVATVPHEKTFMLASPPPLSEGWQRVWQHMDMKRYTAAVPFPIQPVVVLLDAQSPAGGFAREWARLDAGIAVHKGYAFQWFALAATLLVVYVAFNVRPAGGRGHEDDASHPRTGAP
jgi:surfeit locus 1 family protein